MPAWAMHGVRAWVPAPGRGISLAGEPSLAPRVRSGHETRVNLALCTAAETERSTYVRT